jgi:hypothetical protein
MEVISNVGQIEIKFDKIIIIDYVVGNIFLKKYLIYLVFVTNPKNLYNMLHIYLILLLNSNNLIKDFKNYNFIRVKF